ncbi:D-amino acid dehydrogenase small subunit [Comamonas serinivorans]|uniref:D-amino acid dehydrogenase small subunit n=1 Tax=Comamonas serinivorans TaxID=1082851 RepID=A0A1Y0ETD4_9BURK|nr:D-amino acid dehydrogenase [Comamonas serinivorans]ARU06934.1 D-amino acid dehydrogenase small subunit [Comamonas serinivorans]
MSTVVIGAGIVGLMTAYHLAREGDTVTVIDALPGPGQATSYGNGAQLSYSFVAPLAEPSVLAKLPGMVWGKDSPLHLRLRASPAQWQWGLKFLAACNAPQAQQTTRELLQLGAASRERLHALMAEHALQFDFTRAGKLVVYQDEAAFEGARAQMAFQAELGCQQTALTGAECVAREPALAGVGQRLVGGIDTPSEEAGDCHLLCQELERVLRQDPAGSAGADTARAGAVEFRYGLSVRGFAQRGGRVVAVQTSAGPLAADRVVLAAGMGSQRLARMLGVNAGLAALKGYSLTYVLGPDSQAPRVSVTDTHNKVVYARLGPRLRVAGMVDMGNDSLAIAPDRIATLKAQVADFLPQLKARGEPTPWAGLRPARADGKPVVDRVPGLDNAWLHLGHGALGFTLAAGSAALLADRMAGRATALDANWFRL